MNPPPAISREQYRQTFRDRHQQTLELLKRRPELRDVDPSAAVGAWVADGEVSGA